MKADKAKRLALEGLLERIEHAAKHGELSIVIGYSDLPEDIVAALRALGYEYLKPYTRISLYAPPIPGKIYWGHA